MTDRAILSVAIAEVNEVAHIPPFDCARLP
jgi:hypothetical protein